MSFKQILKTALRSTFRQKSLWFLGVFAAFLGQGDIVEIFYNYKDKLGKIPAILVKLRTYITTGQYPEWMQRMPEMITQNSLALAIFITLFLVFVLLILWIASVATGGLIEAQYRFHKNTKITLGEAIYQGLKSSGPILGVTLIGKIFIYLLIVILGFPLIVLYIIYGHMLWNALLILWGIFILIPFNIVVMFVMRYAAVYIVLEKKSINDALRSALVLFWKNKLVSIEMAFLIFGISMATFLALLLLLALLAIPFALIYALLVLVQGGILIDILKILIFGLILAIIILVGAALTTFQIYIWTEFFLKLKEGKAFSKILSVFIPQKKGV